MSTQGTLVAQEMTSSLGEEEQRYRQGIAEPGLTELVVE